MEKSMQLFKKNLSDEGLDFSTTESEKNFIANMLKNDTIRSLLARALREQVEDSNRLQQYKDRKKDAKECKRGLEGLIIVGKSKTLKGGSLSSWGH